MTQQSNIHSFPSQIPFDLSRILKESQLQHGLRTDDYVHYHKYLTHRVATLRRHLNLHESNGSSSYSVKTGGGKRRDGSAALATAATATTASQKTIRKHITPQMLLATIINNNTTSSTTPFFSFSAVDNSDGAAIAIGLSKLVSAFSTTRPDSSMKRHLGGGRYLELLLLYSERAWAAYEEVLHAKNINGSGENTTTAALKSARKKLNKAAKWAEQIYELVMGVVKEVDTEKKTLLKILNRENIINNDISRAPFLWKEEDTLVESEEKQRQQRQTQADFYMCKYIILSIEGYLHEVKGRCNNAHNKSNSALTALEMARVRYACALKSLNELLKYQPQTDVEQAYSLLTSRVSQLDDRIFFVINNIQQQQEHDGRFIGSSVYRPEPIEVLHIPSTSVTTSNTMAVNSGVANKKSVLQTSHFSFSPITPKSYLTERSTVRWMASPFDEIPVFSIQIKQALREAAGCDPIATIRRLLEFYAHTDDIIPVGQQLKILEGFGRTIGFLNDALDHGRQEQRSLKNPELKRGTQRLVLYIQYWIGRKTADRSLFLVEAFARRYWRLKEAKKQQSVISSMSSFSGKNDNAGTKNTKNITGGGRIPSVSPLELIRLYSSIVSVLEDVLQLPGIDQGEPDADDETTNSFSKHGESLSQIIEKQLLLCKVGELMYAGDSHVIVGDTNRATICLQSGLELLSKHVGKDNLKAATAAVEKEKNGNNINETNKSEVSSTGEICLAAISPSFLKEKIQQSLLKIAAEANLSSFRSWQQKQQTDLSEQLDEQHSEKILPSLSYSEKDISPESIADYSNPTLIHNLDKLVSCVRIIPSSTAAVTASAQQSSPNSSSKLPQRSIAHRSTGIIALFVNIPPSYQPIPCKPVFIDIASTFVDYLVPSAATVHSETERKLPYSPQAMESSPVGGHGGEQRDKKRSAMKEKNAWEGKSGDTEIEEKQSTKIQEDKKGSWLSAFSWKRK